MDEILQLSLIETYCLPILTYAAPAVSLKVRQLQELNSCWNSAYQRVFGFHRWESVRSFICGLGRLDLKHVIMLMKMSMGVQNTFESKQSDAKPVLGRCYGQ